MDDKEFRSKAELTKVFTTMGASNHSEGEREGVDYYATDPKAIDDLLRIEEFQKDIWEPACGGGALSMKLEQHGYRVHSTDLFYHGYGEKEQVDFLETVKKPVEHSDIITNPPYKYCREFCEHALSLLEDGEKLALFLKLTFLESQSRRKLFDEHPPKRIHVYSKRILCYKNGDFEKYMSSAICYAWFVWEKGFKGKPEIDWI